MPENENIESTVSSATVSQPKPKPSKPADDTDNPHDGLHPQEREAVTRAGKLLRYIDKKALYFSDDDQPKILLNNQLINLDFSMENDVLSTLFQKVFQSPTRPAIRNLIIQHLRVHATQRASKIQLRRFSAISPELDALYVPSKRPGEVVVVHNGQIRTEANGTNPAKLWLTHPYDDPSEYLPNQSTKAGLEVFERLCIDTQACAIPEMRWFVAMNEGLFPLVRDLCPARFLTVHHGATQQGKTSGAQRFTMLHGLGEVKGDFSVSALSNQGDIGLLVLDNKEQDNFTQQLIDYCLYLSTGAEFGRADQGGNVRRTPKGRPVGILTTIEGLYKEELKARAQVIEYDKAGSPPVFRAYNEAEILKCRGLIFSSLLEVMAQFLMTKWLPDATVPGFGEHFSVICNLFRISTAILGKSSSWVESTIATWRQTITDKPQEENELEHPINRILDLLENGDFQIEGQHRISYAGKLGTAYVITTSMLLGWLQELRLPYLKLPQNAAGFGSRLGSSRFFSFSILNGKKSSEFKFLQRSEDARFIALFRPD